MSLTKFLPGIKDRYCLVICVSQRWKKYLTEEDGEEVKWWQEWGWGGENGFSFSIKIDFKNLDVKKWYYSPICQSANLPICQSATA